MKKDSRQVRSFMTVTNTGREVVGQEEQWWRWQWPENVSPRMCFLPQQREGRQLTSLHPALLPHLQTWWYKKRDGQGWLHSQCGTEFTPSFIRRLLSSEDITTCELLGFSKETPASRLFWCRMLRVNIGVTGSRRRGAWPVVGAQRRLPDGNECGRWRMRRIHPGKVVCGWGIKGTESSR